MDCFEILIERPTNLLARAQTFSDYKHHNTVKVLIGITPQGSICFVSKAWGGRTSGKYCTENCGLLKNLLPGDIVMADRGFTIEDSLIFIKRNWQFQHLPKVKASWIPLTLKRHVLQMLEFTWKES